MKLAKRTALSLLALLLLPLASTGCKSDTANGALIGAGLGAVSGAVIAEATDSSVGTGAVIGAGVGAAAGAAVGYGIEKNSDD